MNVEPGMARFRHLVTVAEKLGLIRLRDAWNALRNELASQPVRIVVLGEFNHGKSSLLNSLFGEPVLPFGVTPTTQLDTWLSFGCEKRSVKAYAGDEMVASWSWDDWMKTNRTMPESLRGLSVDRLAISLDSTPFDQSCIFIDTPGLNEAFLARESYLQRYLKWADLILFVFDANQVLTRTEQSVIRELAENPESQRRILVINKCDRLDDDEWLDICSYVENSLYPIFGEENLYMVSARKKNVGDWDALISRIHSDIELLKSGHEEKYIKRQNDEMQLMLEGFMILYRALEASPREMLVELAKNREFRPVSAIELGEILRDVDDEIERLDRQTKCDMERFEAGFKRAMPREIDKASLESIEKYFEDFIDEAFAQNGRIVSNRIGEILSQTWGHIWTQLTDSSEITHFAFDFSAVERWIKNPPLTGAFDPSGAFGLWSLPLPGFFNERAERPRRDELRKMAELAIERRAAQFRQAFSDELRHQRAILATMIRECGTRFASFSSEMAQNILKGKIVDEDILQNF